MHDNIMQLPKYVYYSKRFLLLLLLFLTQLFFLYFFLFVRLNLLNLKNVLKEKDLYSEVNNIALIANSLVNGILLNALFLEKVFANYTIERVIYRSVIGNNSSQLSNDSVVLQYRKKSILLLFSAISSYRIKSKKSLYQLLLIINKVGIDYQKKVVIRRGLDINKEMNAC